MAFLLDGRAGTNDGIIDISMVSKDKLKEVKGSDKMQDDTEASSK